MRGVHRYYQFTHRSDLPAYLSRLYYEMLNAGLITTVVEDVVNDPSSDFCPNVFAQYLQIAVVAENLGIDALDARFTANGIVRTLNDQTLSTQQATFIDWFICLFVCAL